MKNNPKKILLVEDELAVQDLYQPLLKKAGYQVFVAADGLDAWKIIKKEKLDLILLDLILPRVHGFTILKKLSKNKQTKNIPVIVLSNLNHEHDRFQSLRLGARLYLLKAKYTPLEVLKKVSDTI